MRSVEKWAPTETERLFLSGEEVDIEGATQERNRIPLPPGKTPGNERQRALATEEIERGGSWPTHSSEGM